MAEGDIKINYASLRKNATDMESARGKLSSNIGEASKLINALTDEIWMGNTKTEVLGDFSKHIEADNEFVQSLSSIAKVANGAAAELEAADNKLSDGVGPEVDSSFVSGSLPTLGDSSLSFYPDKVKESTLKKLSGVNGELQARALKFIEKAQEAGYNIVVVSGYRDNKKQRELYNAYLNGTGLIAAPPGKSKHQKGLAIDVAVCDNNWNQIHSSNVGDKKWKELSKIANSVGITWPLGTRDRPHFELDEKF